MIITFPPNQPLTNPPHRYKQGNNTHKKTTCLQINVTSNQNHFFPSFFDISPSPLLHRQNPHQNAQVSIKQEKPHQHPITKQNRLKRVTERLRGLANQLENREKNHQQHIQAKPSIITERAEPAYHQPKEARLKNSQEHHSTYHRHWDARQTPTGTKTPSSFPQAHERNDEEIIPYLPSLDSRATSNPRNCGKQTGQGLKLHSPR